ncbi:hypothetical protein A2W14_01330 [Candidatus Gottesmanbacteria bacterium RBG_16_37_8]|uniref:Uncharacterized protein n=1 Tax=Candidatus Gottesmanbacteria bacterium RBG_16_37_8 TaxID=1798371 RepID=A0A1F5YQ04_9BACT|nr:MAG: hypothetical protein A2W14_01330 [Candidatus Gottesmanbacteria bacterium RBG_16_37_8]
MLTSLNKSSGNQHIAAEDELIHQAHVSKDTILDEFRQTLARLNAKLPPEKRNKLYSDRYWPDPHSDLWELRDRIADIVNQLEENHYVKAIDYYKEQMNWLKHRINTFDRGWSPFLSAFEDVTIPKSNGFNNKLLRQRWNFSWKSQHQRWGELFPR